MDYFDNPFTCNRHGSLFSAWQKAIDGAGPFRRKKINAGLLDSTNYC